MTWTNKNKTSWINLDKISYWNYTTYGSMNTLLLLIDGCKFTLYAEEATEIYKILSDEKQLLKG